jgi:hypothetical protein
MFNTVTSLAALSALAAITSAQALPDNQVPFIGAGVLHNNDPALKNYTTKFRPPFENSVYGGYYSWEVNNNTVAIANFSSWTAPSSSLVKYPFFIINEGDPKPLNLTTSFSQKCRGTTCGCLDHQNFKKILVILFENEVYNWTMGDPWWQLAARRGKLLTNSHGITHPSLPNYAAMAAGDFFGLANEDFYNINATTIYDLLDAKNIDFATYVEWYNQEATERGPHDCNNYVTYGPIDSTNPQWHSQIYRRLDVPPLLFSTYTSNYTRCSKIYNATTKFDEDVFSKTLPPFSWYVPDMLHNGHDPESDSDYAHQSTTSGMWLNSFLDMYLPALTEQETLVVAIFDEATWQNDDDSSPNNNNQMATILFGHGIEANTKNDTYFTQYGLLRGVIDNFGLGSLGRNDTNATNGNLYDFIN